MSTDKEPKFTSVDGTATHDSGGLGGWWNSLPPFQIGIKTPIYEPCNGSFVKAVASEFVHMAAFLFITIGHVVNSCHASNVGLGQAVSGGEVVQPTSCLLTDARTLSIATVFGLAIACLVYSSAVFSGGHLNPAVTIGFLVSKKITVQRAVCYWIAQMLGAILGSAFPYAIDRSGWNAAGGGVNSPLPGISDGAVWTLEALLTMALVFVVFAATDGPRAALGAHLPVLAPFAIGFTVFIAHLVAVPLDGCSINPARSFGPAVISGTWHKQWLFWVGPLCGGVFGALLYEIAFRPSRGDIGPTGEVTIKEPPPTVRLPGYSGAKGRQDRDVVPAGSDSEDLEAQAHHV